MKIAFFTDCYLDLTGGIVSVINAQKTELERRGHTVYVFSSAYPRSARQCVELAKQHIFPVPSGHILLRGLTPIARRPAVVLRFLRKNFPELKNFDVFYAHYEANASIAGLKLAKEYGIPSIQFMHGREDVGETNLVPYGFRTIVASLLNFLHARTLHQKVQIPVDNYLATDRARAKMWEIMVRQANFADYVLTPSQHFRDKLMHYGVTKKIEVLPNSFPDDQIPEDTAPKDYHPDRELKIIWHSRVSAEKRIMPFLQALDQITGKYRLDVYGGGNDLSRAQCYARAHHLNAYFYDTTPFKTIYKKLAKADLDVLVSYNFDTFGMTLIEAESLGVPVFIADPDLTEVVPKGSYILSADPTPTAMAAALNSVFAHPDCIKQMSEIMLKHRNNIKISTSIDKLEKIINKLPQNPCKP